MNPLDSSMLLYRIVPYTMLRYANAVLHCRANTDTLDQREKSNRIESNRSCVVMGREGKG
jgi:hypothetical protein